MIILHLLISALSDAASYYLVGIGFSLIYRVTKFVNFTLAFKFVLGSYITLMFRDIFRLPTIFSIILALIICCLYGCFNEIVFFNSLRKRNSSNIVILLTSLGIYIVSLNLLLLIAGNDTITLRKSTVREGLNIFGARISNFQIIEILTAIIVYIIIMLVLKTRYGIIYKALANNIKLANYVGIKREGMVIETYIISSFMAGYAGILMSYDIGMTPSMGLDFLLMGVVAAILGGIDCTNGVIFGAIFIGTAQHLGILIMGAEWKEVLTFVIMLIFLILRPQGFFGKKIDER